MARKNLQPSAIKLSEDVEIRNLSSSGRPSTTSIRTKSARNLGELVQCELCKQMLNEPRMLPCQHTFCLRCLETDYEKTANDGNFHCPNCRKIFKIENKDAFAQMPMNVFIESIFGILQDSPNTPTTLSLDIRCINCQTVCQFQEQICQHCNQIFCQICWTEHVKELITKLGGLEKQLDNLKIRLNHKMTHFEDRCVKLEATVEQTIHDKIVELNARKEKINEDIVKIKAKSNVSLTNLIKKIDKMKEETKQLKIDSAESEAEKISIFMNLHKKTSMLLEDVSKWGEYKPTFDQDTLRLDFDDNVEEIKEEMTSNKNKIVISGDKDDNNAVIVRYKHPFEVKLFWGKCPRPAGIGISPWNQNLLYVAATDNKLVLIFDRSNNKVIGRLSVGVMSCPHGITFNSGRKEIYVTDKWNNCIHVFDYIGNYLRTLCDKEKILRGPEGIVADSDITLFVCDTGNDRVCLINALNGHLISVIGMVGHRTELNIPTGIAMAGNNIYVADSGNHRIKVYSLTGNKILEIGTKGRERGQLKSPEVVAVDSFGCILVGDSGNNRLQIFKPDGSLIRCFGESGKTPGKFLWVSGITVTKENEIIMTDSKNKTLQIF